VVLGSAVSVQIAKAISYQLDKEDGVMKKFRNVIMLVGIFLFLTSSVGAEQFELKGVEILKGIDRGDTRYGTTFIGKILEEGGDLGYWSVVLNFKDYEYIEVCGETNDIVWLRMVVVFTGGDHQGDKLVLRMRDRKGIPDVFWDYDADLCPIGGIGCSCPDWEVPISCSDTCSDTSSIARIGDEYETDKGIVLTPRRTISSQVENAYLNGWLCHNYPFVPRVSGTLQINWK
jgi:hypothetical protein